MSVPALQAAATGSLIFDRGWHRGQGPRSLSTSGDRNPRLQAKRRVGEVASCDDTDAAVTRCAFKVHLVWGQNYLFALTSSTITSKKADWSRMAVDFKSTAFEPLA